MANRERVIVRLLVLVGVFLLTGCAAQLKAPPELESAILSADHDTVKSILEEDPKLANARIHGDIPLLHLLFRHKDMAEFLIANGADVNAKDDSGHTALYKALNYKRYLDGGGDERHPPDTSFKIECSEDLEDCAKFLIDKGADVNIHTGSRSVLTGALRCGYTEIVPILIAKGADVNLKYERPWPMGSTTPLGFAAGRGDLHVTQLLVAAGANVNAKCEWFRVNATPLGFAAGSGDLQMTQFLVAAGANVNAENKANVTPPLHFAANGGHKEVVEFLIAEGAEVNAKRDCWYFTKPLERLPVIKGPGKEMLTKYLKQSHPAVLRSVSPLYLAARGGHKNVAEILIAEGANVNARAKDGDTPLHEAAAGGHKGAADLLIARGANVNAKGRQDYTPLHSAAGEGHKEVVQLLINKAAQVNAKTDWGGTPLRIAENRRRGEVADLLRKHGGVK